MLVVGGGIALYTLLPSAAGLRDSVRAVRGARLQWVAVAVVATAGGIVAAAVQLLGSTTLALPIGRTARVQLAGAFADVVAPANLGRLSIDVAYLTHAGSDGAHATACVALDGLGGVVVHVAATVLFALVAGAAPGAFFHLPASWLRWVLLGLAAGAVVILVGIRLHWWRSIERSLIAATHAAGETFQRPSKLAD
ncbi:MAG: flippase-like domain-containing protein, partial [Acidimicrobiia bacterium]|nr:flippase-like domain-containing protein [Acidimicrobiia bacterium]